MTPASGSQSGDIKALVVEVQGVREDIAEIKKDVKCLNERQTEFERYYTGEHVKVEAQTLSAHRRLDILEPKVEKIEVALRTEIQTIRDALSPLHLQAKIIVWVAALLGASVIGLIWAIIVGQAQVVFK